MRLSHLVGMTHQEIAERLGVPVGTVKSRSARAHRRLASLLRDLVTPTPDQTGDSGPGNLQRGESGTPNESRRLATLIQEALTTTG